MRATKLHSRTAVHAWLVLLSLCYLALAGSTVGHSTVQYDEFTDLLIAWGLLEQPLVGSSLDPSQARLPMYATGVAVRIVRLFTDLGTPLEALHLSRWLSIAACISAIWGTYILGSTLFDRGSAILAATLFAFSPYVLNFGRDALTQGDAFTAATVVYALAAFVWFDRTRSTAAIFVFGLMLGLAIASKFYLVFLAPALLIYHGISENFAGSGAGPRPADSGPTGIDRPFLMRAALAGGLSLLTLTISMSRAGMPPGVRRALLLGAATVAALALSALFSCFWTAWRQLRAARRRSGAGPLRWPIPAAWAAVLALALAGTLVLFPAHSLNRSILPALVERLLTMDGTGKLFTEAADAVRIHGGVLLFKLGLPLGVVSCFALLWAAYGARRSRALLLITVTLASYALLLVSLPLQQPFWLMSVYPLVVLTLAVYTLQVLRNTRAGLWRTSALLVFLGSSMWLLVGLVRVYPTFGYYGLETVGKSWLGADSRGYRALVVVTNDGSTEAMQWLQANARPGSVVLSYLNDVHLIDYLQRTEGFAFDLRHVLRTADLRVSVEDFASSDYTVVRVIDDFAPHAPVGDPDFVRFFDTQPVHEISRGRGIYRLPVIRIYRRKELD